MKKLLFSAILLAFIYVPANADTVRMEKLMALKEILEMNFVIELD